MSLGMYLWHVAGSRWWDSWQLSPKRQPFLLKKYLHCMVLKQRLKESWFHRKAHCCVLILGVLIACGELKWYVPWNVYLHTLHVSNTRILFVHYEKMRCPNVETNTVCPQWKNALSECWNWLLPYFIGNSPYITIGTILCIYSSCTANLLYFSQRL